MTRKVSSRIAYGQSQSLINIANDIIISQRNPLTSDNCDKGQLWLNEVNRTLWMVATYNLGLPVWIQISSAGSAGGVFTSTTDNTLGPVLLTSNYAYTFDQNGNIAVTLPALADEGDMIWLTTLNSSAAGAGITVTQPAGTTILWSDRSTTAGAGAKFVATHPGAVASGFLAIAILLRCAVDNTTWTVLSCNVAPNLI